MKRSDARKKTLLGEDVFFLEIMRRFLLSQEFTEHGGRENLLWRLLRSP